MVTILHYYAFKTDRPNPTISHILDIYGETFWTREPQVFHLIWQVSLLITVSQNSKNLCSEIYFVKLDFGGRGMKKTEKDREFSNGKAIT